MPEQKKPVARATTTKAAPAEQPNPYEATKVKTGRVRFSYVHVFEPTKVDDNSEPKYSVSLIIPKLIHGKPNPDIKLIKEAIEAAKQNGKESKFGGKIPLANFKTPLRDGDEERADDEAYTDSYFLNASSAQAPGVVDVNREPIEDKNDFYSGCYGRASINFYPFAKAGNKGIACGLNNLQKLADGEPLGGRLSAEDDFDDDFTDEGDDF